MTCASNDKELRIRRIAVYCGSAPGRDPAWREAAVALGRELARRRIGLVFGGGHVGIMGALADAMLDEGGEIIGVIPQSLVERELAHERVTDMRIVETMHERKALMAELSGAFIALPGGLGTLEELFEAWTWAQLGLHAKPVGVLDVGGFWQPLVALVEHQIRAGLVEQEQLDRLVVEREPAALLDALAARGAMSV